jgi:WD40 repeat protein
MEKRPADRYSSAKELADDLRRYLAGEPIKARPAAPIEKIMKWSRRHRTMVSVVAGATVLLMSVVVVSFVLINKERVRALEALDKTSEAFYMADINAAQKAWERGWMDEAQTILQRQKPKDGPDRRGLEWFLLDRATRPPKPVVLAGHAGAVNELAVCPDPQFLASVGDDGTLRIWNRYRTMAVATIPIGKGPLHSVAISPDGRYVAAGSRTLYLWDRIDLLHSRALFHAEHSFESLAFTPDGQYVAGGQRYHEVILFSLDGTIVRRVPCTSRVESLEFTPKESQLLVPNRRPQRSGNTRDVVELWRDDLSKLEQEFTPRGYSAINIVRSSPSGESLAAIERDSHRICVLDKTSGRIMLETPRGPAIPTALAYSPDANTIAAVYENGDINFLELNGISDQHATTQWPTQAIRGHNGMIADVKYLTNETIATCGADGLVKVWDLSQLGRRIPHVLQKVFSLGLSPDGRVLACVGRLNFKLLDQRGRLIHNERLEGNSKRISWSPSGNRVAVCCTDRNAVVVFSRSGEKISTIAHEGAAAAAFSSDDKMLAIVGGKKLALWRADDGGEVHQHALQSEGSCVAFSPNGRYLAYGGHSHSIMLTDSTGQSVLHELPCNSYTSALAFSPDSSMLVSGHEDSAIRLWSATNGKLQTELLKDGSAVNRLAFSADGRTLLSAARDGTIRAWSVDQSRDYGIVYRVDVSGENQAASEILVDFSLSSDDRRVAILFQDRDGRHAIELWDLQEPPPAANDAVQ